MRTLGLNMKRGNRGSTKRKSARISNQLGAGNIRQDVQEAITQEISARLSCLLNHPKASALRGLTRKDKELILMAITCIQERASLAELHARAAIFSGAQLAEVVEVAVLTIMSRGMPQFKRAGLPAVQAAEALVAQGHGKKGKPTRLATNNNADRRQEIRDYVRQSLGIKLPDMFAKLEELAPYALDGYMRMRQGVLNDGGAATKKVKELVMTAMDIIIGNAWGAPIHSKQAMVDGATVQEVVETVALTLVEGGLHVYRNGGEDVIRTTEAT
jgi:alkylhydroperoxidase/carboxymuconolactone decarboxylase family protein YurZ